MKPSNSYKRQCYIKNMKTHIENLNPSHRPLQHRVRNISLDMEIMLYGDDPIPMNIEDCWEYIINDFLKCNLGITYNELLQEHYPEELI